MNTLGQIARGAFGVLGDSGINGSVAVAAAALVVVLTIVVVFVMVLRSNGSAGKTAHGLGYDAQRGPMGQPQNDPDAAWGAPPSIPADAAPWGAQPRANAANGWSPAADLASNGAQGGPFGQMGASAPASGAGSHGGWGAAPSANSWDAPAAQQPDAAPWGAPQRGTGPGWDAPAAPASMPAAGAWGTPANSPSATNGAPPWAAPAADHAPWDAGVGTNAPAWGGQPAASPSTPSTPAAGGWGAGQADAAPAWGAAQADQSNMSPWGAAPAARQGVPSAPMAGNYGGNGYDAAPPYGDERTRVARPGGSQRLGVLVVRQGKEPGREFEIRSDRMTIGRSRDSDIFLEDLAVSRLHTTVGRDNAGNYVIRDENSANGTYVNNQRITEQPLEEGDEIQVGQSVLAFMTR
jgi:hypothetical protein